MSIRVVERAYFILDGVEFDCKTVELTVERDGADSVKTMNRLNRSKSHKLGIPMFSLSCEVPLPEGRHDIDFIQYCLDGTEFTSTIEYQDGEMHDIYDCIITQVGETSSSGDEVTTRLEISGLDYGAN